MTVAHVTAPEICIWCHNALVTGGGGGKWGRFQIRLLGGARRRTALCLRHDPDPPNCGTGNRQPVTGSGLAGFSLASRWFLAGFSRILASGLASELDSELEQCHTDYLSYLSRCFDEYKHCTNLTKGKTLVFAGRGVLGLGFQGKRGRNTIEI